MQTNNNFQVWLKKGFTIILIAFLVFSLSGCRTKCNEESDDWPECAGISDDGDNKSEKINLVIWNLHDSENAFKGQIQAFESEHKGVNIEYIMFSDEDEYEKLLIDQMAEGNGPDIFTFHHSWLPKHKEKMVPAPAELIVPEKFRDTFSDVAAEVLIIEDEDEVEEIYGLPLFIDTLAIYYNKTVFRDSGLSITQPGETWEDIKEQTFTLTKKNNSVERFALAGMAMGRSDNISLGVDIFTMLLLQEGASIFDDSEKAVIARQQGTTEGTGKAFYPGKEAMTLYTSFTLPSFKNYSWNSTITGLYSEKKEVGAFARGKVAMIFGYSDTYADIVASIEGMNKNNGEGVIRVDEIGTAPAPQFTSLKESASRDALAKLYPLAVSKHSDQKKLAWELLIYLASAESTQEYHNKTNKPTARRDLIDEQSAEKDFGVFARQVSYSKVLTLLNKNDYKIIISHLIDQVASSKMSIDDALVTAEKRLQCVIDKELKSKNIGVDCTSQ